MLNFLVAEDRIKNLKILLASSTPVQFLYKPWAKWCSWAMLSFGEDILFLVNNKWFDCFLFLLFLLYYFYFSVNSFETLGLKQTDCQLEKRDHRFVEKGSLLHWKITNSLSIQFQLLFFSLHDGQFFISCSFFYWSIHSSSKGLIKRLDQLIYYNICYV